MVNDIILTPDGLKVYDSTGKILFEVKRNGVEIKQFNREEYLGEFKE